MKPIILLVLSCAVLAGCRTNTPAIDTGQASLSSLITTNNPGDYPLPGAWDGIAKVTVRTGFFATGDGRTEGDEPLRFDRFTLSSPPIPSRFIWSDKVRWYVYRASLPPDSELIAAHKFSALTELFGESQDPTDGVIDSRGASWTVDWRFFSPGSNDTIETVSVFCMIEHRQGEDDSDIEAMLVKRGIMKPAKR